MKATVAESFGVVVQIDADTTANTYAVTISDTQRGGQNPLTTTVNAPAAIAGAVRALVNQYTSAWLADFQNRRGL